MSDQSFYDDTTGDTRCQGLSLRVGPLGDNINVRQNSYGIELCPRINHPAQGADPMGAAREAIVWTGTLLISAGTTAAFETSIVGAPAGPFAGAVAGTVQILA